MRSRSYVSVVVAHVAVGMSGCTRKGHHQNGNDGGNGDPDMQPFGTLSISPNDVTLDLAQGQPPPTQTFTVTLHATDGDHDVTGGCTYSLGDPTLGTMNGSTSPPAPRTADRPS
jgi:hypothetical protein